MRNIYRIESSSKLIFLIIFFCNLFLFGSVSNQNKITIKSEFGRVICPNGKVLNLPVGITLDVAERKFGNRSIVKIPKKLNKKCDYGILTYTKYKNAGISSDEKAKGLKVLEKYSSVADKMNYADRCKDEFIGSDGLGNWGQFIKKELSSNSFSNLLKNNKVFQNSCPGYSLMKNDERKNLWVFVLMAMSHYESSCRPQVEAQGPHGIAKGLFQLHENSENKYTHWDIDGVCKKGGSSKPKESLKCTLSMLNGQIEKYNSLFFNKSYWDVLRYEEDPETHASKIKNAISMLKGCNSRNLASKDGVITSKADSSQRRFIF